MEKIRVCTRENDYTKTRYYRTFRIYDRVPADVEVEQISIDCEQGNMDAHMYDYYRTEDSEGSVDYIAVLRFPEITGDFDISTNDKGISIEFVTEKFEDKPEEHRAFILKEKLSRIEDEWDAEDFASEWVLEECPPVGSDSEVELIQLLVDTIKEYLNIEEEE